MKKIFKSIALVAVAAASLFSCQKPNPVEPDQKEYTYTFTLSNTDTKAILATEGDDTFTKWESGDQLGVYTFGESTGTSYNRFGNINTGVTPVQFQISSYYALGTGDKVYCYFPYDANNSKGDAQNPTKVTLTIPTSQNGKMNAMPMVSVPYTMTSSVAAQTNEPIADINMRNLGGVFQFNIFSTNAEYQTETIESVEFNANAAIAGSFVYDITQEELAEISGYTETSVTVKEQNLAVAGNKNDASKVLMVVAPGTHNGSLVVTTDVAIYTLNFSSAKTVERSHVKPLNVDLKNASRELRPVDPTGEVTKTMSEVVSENGYTVSSGSTINDIVTEIALDDIVTMSTTGQANCGSFWNSNNTIDWRLYQNKGGNIILTLAEGYKMTSVTFVYTVGNNGLLKYGETNLSSNVAFTGIKGQSSATFNVSASSGTSGQIKLTSVTVAYTSGEIEKDDSQWMLEPESVAIMVGDYEAVVYATDFDGDIEVSIDDDTVADVALDKDEETITVTGKKIGEATITITATGSDRFKDAELTIPVSISAKQKVDPTVTIESSATVEAESTVELDLEIDNNYDGTITAVSAADGTATASYAAGKVTINGVAPGSTTVTVSAEETENYNAFSKEISVTVTEKAKSKAITLANGVYSGSGNDAIITWNEGQFALVQAKGSSNTAVNSSYIANPRFYASNVITLTPASGITITKIEFVNASDYNNGYKYNGTAIAVNGTTHTWIGSSTSAIEFIMAGQARPSSITVYYTGSVVKTDASISFDPSSVTIGEGLNTTVNITTNYDKELTVSSNNANATASISGKVITINGVSAGNAVITVSGTGSELYNDVNETINVTVNATPKFSVNIDSEITGGTVTADKTSEISEGATVTLTVSSDPNKTLNTLTVKNANTQAAISTTKVSDGEYTFQMPAANVNVTAVFSDASQKTTKTFEVTSAAVVTNSGYNAYTNTVDNRNWAISFGGNNKSVGTNSGNRSKCNLNASAYQKYAVSGTASTSDVASVFACSTKLSDVKKISYTFNGGSNQTNTNVYILYSADGTTYSQVSLSKGTQGSAISSGTEFEFATCTGYFAVLFKATNSSGNWRIDDVNLTFTYEE